MNQPPASVPLSIEQTMKLSADPEYLALRRARRNMCWGLTLFNVTIYSLYILSIAYGGEIFTMRFGSSVINLGLWFTVFVILFAFSISGFYIWWTNNHHDPALSRLVKRYIQE